jgi:5-carboxymethyl-2-hydroxymuconate isomerase
MPHLVILYTNNLETQTDMSALCRKLANAMLTVQDEDSQQVFPTGGLRVLAYPAAHCAVADGQRDYAFVYLNLRMGRGRSDTVKKKAGETLRDVALEHLAFVLEKPLRGPGVSLTQVLNATAYVVPALEIIDARIEQFDRDTKAPRKVFDTIADFAANAGIVTGGRPLRPDALDLRWVGAMLYKNAVIEETGLAAGVLNHPASGVAWLANKIAPYDEQLNPGDLVLGGSFIRPTLAARGDVLHADYGPLGNISFRFV